MKGRDVAQDPDLACCRRPASPAAGLWWRYGRGAEVAAVAAQRGTAVEIVYATGAVEPVRWAKVTSLIRDRIVDICHCEGETVAKGDVLARLDDREVQAQLQELRAREEFLQARIGARHRTDGARLDHDPGLRARLERPANQSRR